MPRKPTRRDVSKPSNVVPLPVAAPTGNAGAGQRPTQPAPDPPPVAAKAKGKPGRKPWIPTAQERQLVERCVALGFTQAQIAGVVGKSESAIYTHCKDELANGAAKVNAKVGGKLIQKALAGDIAALIFFAKTRLGMSEKQLHEFSGPGGGPIKYETIKAEADAFTKSIEQHAHKLGPMLQAEVERMAAEAERAKAEPHQIN